MIRPRHSSSPSEPACRRGLGRAAVAFLAVTLIGLMPILLGLPTASQAQQAESLADGGLISTAGDGGMKVERIGLIDIEGVLRASSGAAKVRDLLDEQRRAFQQEFAEREAALQQTERDLVAKRGELSEAEFTAQLATFEAEVTQIQKEIQYRREAIDIAFQEAQAKLRELALQIVTELAQEKRLDLVLVRESALIFLPSLNLSDEVLRRLNERTKNARIEVTIGAATTGANGTGANGTGANGIGD